MTHERRLRADALARVEGEGGMAVSVRDGKVVSLALDIYEPPRFFEAFLRGRHYTEPPDITSRICGICPIAYQMSAVQAVERAFGVEVTQQVQALRRLIYCGEWIESHALHIYLLHAPDFLGYESAISLAADHRDTVARGLRLKQVGNRLMDVVGGRSVHPINARVGGFHRAPPREALDALVPDLEWARDAAVATVDWVAGFDFPDVERDYQFVALRHPDLYPIIEGRVASSRGLDIDISEYEANFTERQVAHSTALYSAFADGSEYLVGPLARYALNAPTLSATARQAARAAGLEAPCRNPFRSIVVRAVEVVYACDEALRLIAGYEPPDPPAVDVALPAADTAPWTGMGATEAPRGILYQRYDFDGDGLVTAAKIVPPTAQNQATIEADLRAVVEGALELPDEQLSLRAEQAIRNHDPCISCATHFLDLTIDRG